MKRFLSVALASAAILFSLPLAAQNYPNRTVTVVVPFPAGGSVDGAARILVQKLNETPGHTFVVENRAGGAGGNVGSNTVAKAPPDGYTLLLSASIHVINPFLFKNVPYDVVADFTPVSLLAVGPLIVSTTPSVPAKNLKEFFDLVRATPDKFTFGTTGVGSASHLAIELLKREGGVNTLYWFANDSFVTAGKPGIALPWKPAQPGRYLLRVVDEQGRADSREVVVMAAP